MENSNNEEKFELSLRLLGNEVVGFKLSSDSSRKNWIMISVIVLVALAAVANMLTPLITALAA